MGLMGGGGGCWGVVPAATVPLPLEAAVVPPVVAELDARTEFLLLLVPVPELLDEAAVEAPTVAWTPSETCDSQHPRHRGGDGPGGVKVRTRLLLKRSPEFNLTFDLI